MRGKFRGNSSRKKRSPEYFGQHNVYTAAQTLFRRSLIMPSIHASKLCRVEVWRAWKSTMKILYLSRHGEREPYEINKANRLLIAREMPHSPILSPFVRPIASAIMPKTMHVLIPAELISPPSETIL